MPFMTSLMFVGKARSLPKSGETDRFVTQVTSGLTNKHFSSIEIFQLTVNIRKLPP